MTLDIFEKTRTLFDIPSGVIYLDGNSLGPLPLAARKRVADEVDLGWGEALIRAWNTRGWMDLPAVIGDKIAALVGAPKGSVMAADSTSVNLFKALTAALQLTGDRKVILSDTGNFPTDLYIAEGVIQTMGKGHQLKIVAPDAVADSIDETVAVLMITEVDFSTGRLHDMKDLTARAHAAGVITIWDLAHSAGAFPVDVRPDLQDKIKPSLSGWLGHAAPFQFTLDYQPGPSIERMRAGTPPILSMVALDAALSAWDGVSLAAIRARSIELSEHFIREVARLCPDLRLASPRDPLKRGSQVSFHFHSGYAAMQALIANNVIGDFRAPDIMRFGFTPLYLSLDDVTEAARRIAVVMAEKQWQKPEYQVRSKVT